MAGRNYFINGITELLILSILAKHDSYVYEIVKSITDNSHNLLFISQNTIYTAAYKLEEEGKISQYSKLAGKKRTRIYYRIEPSGKKYLNDLLLNYQCTISGVQNILDSLNKI
ncbi:MAG: PadR family transcriptional regulator [Eubacterium sp.]